MASLAELLNDTWSLIQDRAKKSSDAARAVTGITDADGVLDIARKTANAEIVPESQRIAGTAIPRIAGQTAATPTALWTLADIGQQVVRKHPVSALGTIAALPTAPWTIPSILKGAQNADVALGEQKPGHLPGGEGAAQITKDIMSPVNELSEAVVGKPVTDDLLSGTPNDLMGSWSRLAFGAGATAPTPLVNLAYNAAAKVKTGSEIVNTIGANALKTLEVMSPIIIAKNPTSAMANTSVAAGAALGAGIESVLGPTPIEPKQTEAKTKVDSYAAGALDSAAQGLEEGKKVKAVQAGVPDVGWEVGAGLGLVGLGALSYWKRGATYRAIRGLDQRESSEIPGLVNAKEVFGDASAPMSWVKRELEREAAASATPKSLIGGISPTNRSTGVGGGSLSQRNRTANANADQYEVDIARSRGASVSAQAKNWWDTGEVPNSALRTLPVNDVIQVYRKFDDTVLGNPGATLGKVFSGNQFPKPSAKQQAAIDLLNYEREIVMRQRIADDVYGWSSKINVNPSSRLPGQNSNTLFRSFAQNNWMNDKDITYHYYDPVNDTTVSTADLYTRINALKQDPDVVAMRNSLLDVTKVIPKWLEEQKHITRKERLNLEAKNPIFVPTKLVQGKSHLGELNPKARGGLQDPGNPFEELPKYLDEILRDVEWNKMNRELIHDLRKAADGGSAFAKKFLGRRDTDIGPHANEKQGLDKTIFYRDHLGNSRSQEITDPVLARAMKKGSSPAELQVLAGAMGGIPSKIARLKESGATGALSALTGSFFAVKSALYASTFGTAFRDPRVSAGWIDHWLQEATGALSKSTGGKFPKFGMPGDPTMIGDAAFRMGTQISAVIAQRMSRALRDTVINDGKLAQAYGPEMMKASKVLETYFQASSVAELQRRSMLGPGSLMSIDPSKRYNDVNNMMKSRNAPESFMNFINDLLHAVSSAPGASVMAMNKNKPKWVQDYAIRNFSGDPSKSGSFQGTVGNVAGHLTSASSYGNIYLQANIRVMEALKKNPTTALVGLFNSGTFPAITAGLVTANMGAEYVDYWLNKRTPDQRASSIYVPIPGYPPEQGLEIPLDPIVRWPKLLGDVLVATHLGLWDGSFYKQENAGIRQAISEMTRHGFSEQTKAVFNQSLKPPMPPIVEAGAAALGVKIRSYGEATNIPQTKRAGFSEGGGRDPMATFMGQYEYPQSEEIVRAIGADGMLTLYKTYMNSEKMAGEGFSTKDIVNRNVQQYGQRASDAAKYVSGPLFGNHAAISPSMESSGTLVKQKLQFLQKAQQAFKDTTASGINKEDYIGTVKRGLQQLEGQGPAQPPQGMMDLAYQASKVMEAMQRDYLTQSQDMYKQRTSIQNSTKFSPEEKREKLNFYADKIINIDRLMLQDLQRLEAVVSKRLGRQIKFESLDLNESVNKQFKPLNQSPPSASRP